MNAGRREQAARATHRVASAPTLRSLATHAMETALRDPGLAWALDPELQEIEACHPARRGRHRPRRSR